MSIEVMRQALEALEDPWKSGPDGVASAITAIRAATEQAEKQEPLGYWNAVQGWVELPDEPQPVAWVYPEALEAFRQGKPWTAYGSWDNGGGRIPLYTAPRQWVGLTDEEIMETVGQITTYRGEYEVAVGHAIEAKLKEKNDVLRSV
jgi:hypothetical protein